MGMIDLGLIDAFCIGVTPPVKMGVAEWAEKHYYLPPESSAEPGLIDFARTPYQYGIMEAWDDPEVEVISMMVAAQMAKTTVILAALGKTYTVAGEGAPVLVLMPTIDNCQMLSRERIQPMIDHSPDMKRAEVKGRKGEVSSTNLQKRSRNGTVINLVGSNAPAGLASRSIKVLLADEVDRFAVSAGHEGNPLALAMRRLNTFKGNGAKAIITSTPTLRGISEIERYWNMGDQRIFLCKCPHCEHEHELVFDNLEWDGRDEHGHGGDYETARYPCPDCGTCWSEADRLQAITEGHWEITRPWIKGHASFRSTALISPWVGNWKNAAKEFIESRGDPALERVFVNTFLGETYSSDDLNIDEEELIKRMEGFGLDLIPEEVLAITGGADIQRDRIELTTIGHSETQSYILAHEIIHGDTSGTRVWSDFEEALSRKFQHALGNEIGYDAVAVDSGYLTQTVMGFAEKNSWRGVVAVKGVSGERPQWEQSKGQQQKGKILFLVGVDDGKATFMERLKNADTTAPGYIHICDMGSYAGTWAEQALSEYRDVSFSGGRPVVKWVRKSSSHRAEALDCIVYGYAIRHSLKPNWPARRKALIRVPEPEPEPEPGSGQSATSSGGWAKF